MAKTHAHQRTKLSDKQWSILEPHVTQLTRCGRKTNLRNFIEAVVWVLRTGTPWRDLHEEFGPWTTVYRRFRRWVLAKRFERLYTMLAGSASDVALLLLDSTIVRAHPHAAGAAGGQEHQALGRSRGGFGTKIHAVVSERGRAVALMLTAGQKSDVASAPSLLGRCGDHGVCVVADKAYDSDNFVEQITKSTRLTAIPSRRNRRHPRRHSDMLYRCRNVVERFFGRIKQFRRIATRYDKTAGSFFSFISVAVACMFMSGWN